LTTTTTIYNVYCYFIFFFLLLAPSTRGHTRARRGEPYCALCVVPGRSSPLVRRVRITIHTRARFLETHSSRVDRCAPRVVCFPICRRHDVSWNVRNARARVYASILFSDTAPAASADRVPLRRVRRSTSERRSVRRASIACRGRAHRRRTKSQSYSGRRSEERVSSDSPARRHGKRATWPAVSIARSDRSRSPAGDDISCATGPVTSGE